MTDFGMTGAFRSQFRNGSHKNVPDYFSLSLSLSCTEENIWKGLVYLTLKLTIFCYFFKNNLENLPFEGNV